MKAEDIIPLAVLGGGIFLLNKAYKKPPRKMEDRTGEVCDPNKKPPCGYECNQVRGGWELAPEKGEWIGFGHYVNRQGVDDMLKKLGFPGGDLVGFQNYMSRISDWDLRQDGVIDKKSILALKEAEGLLRRDEWIFPGEL